MAPYNDQDSDVKTRADNDELRKITDINLADEKAMDARAHEDDEDQSDNQDEDSERGGLNDLEARDARQKKKTTSNSDDEEKDFAPNLKDEKTKKKKLRGRILNRKTAIGGGISGLVIGGTLGLFGLLQGPAQLLQLSSSLGKHESAHTNIVNRRINRMIYRSMFNSADDRLIGARSRLGFVQNKVFGGMMDRLQSQHGITFAETTGRITGASRPGLIFDLPDGHPLKGASASVTKLNIARALGIDATKIGGTIGNNDSSFRITQSNLTTAELDGMKSWLSDNTKGGRITGKLNPRVAVSINKRLFAKTLRLPSLFRPISRLSEAAGRRVDNFPSARRARKQADAERSRASATVNERKTTARATLRSKAGPNVMKTAGAAVALQGVMCMVKDIAGIIPGVYYATIVMPAMIRSIQIQSAASQLQSNQDFSIVQMGDVAADLRDAEGRSVWDAKSINALSNGGEGAGTDIDVGARSAFTTQGGSIKELTTALGYDEIAGTDVSDSVSGWACSSVGRITGLVVGLGLTVGGIVGGVITGGTTTAGAVTRVAVQGTLAATVSYTVSRLLGEFVDGQVRGKLTDSCGVELDSGEGDSVEDIEVMNASAFGNCMAYGSRMASNINAASMGGVPISMSDESALLNEVNQKEIASFKQKSIAERLFSIHEEKSLLMAVMQPSFKNTLFGRDFGSFFSSLFKAPATIISGFASLMTPNAHAQAAYDWGFPLFSMPSYIVDDPNYSDPIENVEWVVNNRNSLNTDRMKKCFGVKIEGVGEKLRTVPLDTEINPLSDDYKDGNCGDLSDPAWIRTALFVLDDSIARAMDCHDGEDTACGEIGMGKGGQPEAVGKETNTGSSAQYIPDCSANGGNAKIACVAIDGMLGIPYKNGYSRTAGCQQSPAASNDPNPSALDCSAFTSMAVYRAFGTDAPRTSTQYPGHGNFEIVGDTRSGSVGDIRNIQPGDIIGKGSVSSGAGGSGHVGIVVSYDRATGALVTVETDRCDSPSRIVTTKGLSIDGKNGTYTWAVRYTGPQNPSPGGQ